jgi:hypothetical protein
MNEFLLFIIVSVIIFGGYFLLKKVPKPAINYIRIVFSILLMVLVWWAWGGDGDRSAQFILTALAISSLIKEIWALKKFHLKA